MQVTKKKLKDLVYQVNGAAIEVHKALGLGLLESVYHKCLIEELKERNLLFVSEMIVPVSYKTIKIETELRADFLVENNLVVEIKAVDALHPIHEAQILTYMKLLNVPIGLLINFNVVNIFKEGQKTFVNEIYRNLNEF